MPVEDTHVEVDRCEPRRVSSEALEAESGSKLVQIDEGSVVEPGLELFPPKPTPPPMGVGLLEAFGVESPQGLLCEGVQGQSRRCGF